MPSRNVTMTATGVSAPIVFDGNAFRYDTGVGLICTTTATTPLYTVQITGDNTQYGITNWNNHDTIVNSTQSVNGNIAFPVTAVRLNVTTLSNGYVNLAVVEVE